MPADGSPGADGIGRDAEHRPRFSEFPNDRQKNDGQSAFDRIKCYSNRCSHLERRWKRPVAGFPLPGRTGGHPSLGGSPMASPEQLIHCLQRVNATMLALTRCLSEECTLEERKLILQLASESADQSRRIRKLFYQLYGSDPYSEQRRAYGFRSDAARGRKSKARTLRERRLHVIRSHNRSSRQSVSDALSLSGDVGTAPPALRPEEASPPAEARGDEKADRPFRTGVPPVIDSWRR